MSKKKRNVIIVVTALLFFGTLLFNLKYPLISETSAEPGKIAQENTVKDSKDDSKADDVNKTDEAVDRQETEEQVQDKEELVEDKNPSKPDSNTSSKSSSQSPVTNNTDNQDKVSKPVPKPAPKPEPKPEPKPAPNPQPTPTPKPVAYAVPSSNHFYSVRIYPISEIHRPDISISMNIWEDYETQLSELYSTIVPVTGSSKANEIVSYARTKTEAHIELNKTWYVGDRRLEIGSTWGSGIVCFVSWR